MSHESSSTRRLRGRRLQLGRRRFVEHAGEQMLLEVHDALDRVEATRRVVVARSGERGHRKRDEEQGNRGDLSSSILHVA